ncbi:glycosyltransferase family 9 protein [Demequina sp. SO4-13]|uniref:glycosyltransferase family 9 protein n=1 Tax=Demequina sp. SO4-13 TaxID=3401027 RepID=UPI003AF74932
MEDTAEPERPIEPNVARIAVLRGGGLGDLMFAMPALAALRRAYPQAEIILLGTAVHRELLAGRAGPVDEVVVMPEDDPDRSRVCEEIAARGVDVAVQMHGGGRHSNPVVRSLQARVTVGQRTPDALSLDRDIPFAYWHHEALRWLETVTLLGAAPCDLEPHLVVKDEERQQAERLREELMVGAQGPLVVVHPGALDPRRRWPAERFGEVAARIVETGGCAVVVGSVDEAPLAHEVVMSARGRLAQSESPRVLSLAGALDLGSLLGLLDRADALVGNDSGPRHLAHAVGTATASVYWCGNVINAAPITRHRHRVSVGWTTRCPTCGVPQARADQARCPHDDSFVSDVSVDELYGELEALVASSSAVFHSSRNRESE